MADTNTVVGETSLVKGNLQGDEDLTVQGKIEGSINLSKTLIIEQSGVVKAEVSVNNAVISGVMVGNLTATDSVEISDTGRMLGDINAPRVIIVEGALFKGKVDMGNLEMPRPTSLPERKASSYTPRPVAKPEPVAPKPAKKAQSKPAAKKSTPARKTVRKKAKRRSKKKVVVKKKRR